MFHVKQFQKRCKIFLLKKRNIPVGVEYYYYRSIIAPTSPQIKKGSWKTRSKEGGYQIRGGYKVLNTLTT